MNQMNALAFIVAVSLAMLGTASMSAAQQAGSNEDEAAIRKVIVEMTEGFNNHDGEAAARMYTPDARFVSVRGDKQQFGSSCRSSACDRAPLGETGPVIHLDFRRNRKLGPMTRYPTPKNDFQIDRIHNGAVCKEIGERLSIALGPQSIELQPRLGSLMKQLSEQA